MKRRWTIVLAAVVLVVLGGGAGALYAYDAARSDVIAHGVVVAGVPIGGLSRDEARQKLLRVLAPRMSRRVTIQFGRRRIFISTAALKFKLDTDAMVAEAVQESRRGTFVGRAIRELAGDHVHARLPAKITYSNPVVWSLVRRVKKHVAHPPVDAWIEPSGDTLIVHGARNGVAVRWRLLAFTLVRELANPTSSHVIQVPVLLRKPKVSRAKLVRQNPWYITINRGAFQLHLWHNLRLYKTYTIAVGQIGLETPAGLYHVQNKEIDPAWHVPNSPWAGSLAGQVIPGGVPENPLKARWLGIANGAGIHGTDSTWSLGHAASHGCIRMAIPDVIQLYDLVPLHAPVYIQ